MAEIIFEELEKEEKKLLLKSFNYDVDPEGFILDYDGNRIPSKEIPNKFLDLDNSMLTPGSLNVLDGTPESISEFIREKLGKTDA